MNLSQPATIHSSISKTPCSRCLAATVASIAIAVLSATTDSGSADEVLIAQRINAKEFPHDLAPNAIGFTGPSGDGRRGSAGFLYPAGAGNGTRLNFRFHRDVTGYGFQIIHPLQNGHVLVSVHSRGVTIHRGGLWSAVGWGDPASSDPLELLSEPRLDPNVEYHVLSELSSSGHYQLSINNQTICRHTIAKVEPLVLRVSEADSVWGGIGRGLAANADFTGKGFQPNLKPGQVGLVLGPMDGSGPNQNFQRVRLTALPPVLGPLVRRVDNAREFGELVETPLGGGPGGGPFKEMLDEPAVLVGFVYTLSTLYGGHLTIKSLRPIFLTERGEALGVWHGAPHGDIQRVQAKPGYAATSFVLKHGNRIDGMRVLFMRVEGARLNPDDAYRSDWIGGVGGGDKRIYGVYGDPIVGIHGRQGNDIDAIGCIQVDTP